MKFINGHVYCLANQYAMFSAVTTFKIKFPFLRGCDVGAYDLIIKRIHHLNERGISLRYKTRYARDDNVMN